MAVYILGGFFISNYVLSVSLTPLPYRRRASNTPIR